MFQRFPNRFHLVPTLLRGNANSTLCVAKARLCRERHAVPFTIRERRSLDRPKHGEGRILTSIQNFRQSSKKNLRIVLFRCIFEKRFDKTIAESKLQDSQNLQGLGNSPLLRITRATCKIKRSSDEIASPFRISNDNNKVLLPL